MSNCSVMSIFPMIVTPSLGGVFGEIRFSLESCSLFGWPL